MRSPCPINANINASVLPIMTSVLPFSYTAYHHNNIMNLPHDTAIRVTKWVTVTALCHRWPQRKQLVFLGHEQWIRKRCPKMGGVTWTFFYSLNMVKHGGMVSAEHWSAAVVPSHATGTRQAFVYVLCSDWESVDLLMSPLLLRLPCIVEQI